MNYNNFDELKNAWKCGDFDYQQSFSINNIEYNLNENVLPPITEILSKKSKGFVLYSTSANNQQLAEDCNLSQMIVFLWESNDGINITPIDIQMLNKTESINESTEYIGDVVILKVMLPSGIGALKGKVDTGADVCSLHAENISVMGDMVKFISPELSRSQLTLPISQYHAVKSADGGTKNRPVIELDIEINGKPVKRAQFNLNDRSDMEYPVLVGQNVLEKTNFLIDPKQDDVKEQWSDSVTISQEFLNETFNDVTPQNLTTDMQHTYDTLQQACELLKQTFDVSTKK